MGLGEAINTALGLQKSVRGIADIGRQHLSQAVQLIALCREISVMLSNVDVWDDLQQINATTQRALNGAIKKHKDTDNYFDAATEEISQYASKMKISIRHIRERMQEARTKDQKTAARLLPVMQKHEIKKAMNQAGRDVKVDIILGKLTLTGDQVLIPATFNSEHNIHSVMWLLVQQEQVKLTQNPHFYAHFSLESYIYTNGYENPIPFETKLDDIINKETNQRERRIHVLTDQDHRMIVQTPVVNKIFGNMWTPSGTKKGQAIVLKDISGTLQKVSEVHTALASNLVSLKYYCPPKVPKIITVDAWTVIVSKAMSRKGYDFLVEFATESEKRNHSRREDWQMHSEQAKEESAAHISRNRVAARIAALEAISTTGKAEKSVGRLKMPSWLSQDSKTNSPVAGLRDGESTPGSRTPSTKSSFRWGKKDA